MRYIRTIILVVLVVLSIAAGAAKLFQMPQEIQFFASAGLAEVWLLPLGALQVVGGFLIFLRPLRTTGASLMALGFIVSAIIIFMTGQWLFGLISLIPAVLSAGVSLDRKSAN